jgi:hypothetical protein
VDDVADVVAFAESQEGLPVGAVEGFGGDAAGSSGYLVVQVGHARGRDGR